MIVHRVLVVGAGYAGSKRARIAADHPGSRVVGVCDVDRSRAEKIAAELGCQAYEDAAAALSKTKPDIAIVSTTNREAMPIARAALEAGADVLVEKPFGRNVAEARAMVAAATAAKRSLAVGFTLRYQPALVRARELAERGEIGTIQFVRCVYGHGGRRGYEREWRADPEIAGGGELLDQGVHVVDLLVHWLGRPARVQAELTTLAWPMQVEDNAFATLRWAEGPVAQFHVSWSQWINRFTWQVYGSEGAIEVEGLGGSYGVPTLTHWKRRDGVPERAVETFEGGDAAWAEEWAESLRPREGRSRIACSEEALEAMEVVEELRGASEQ